MIAYFDTSALVPLVINEPASATCGRLWNEAARVISTRLIYPESRAALALAQRMRRLITAQLGQAVDELDSIAQEISYLEIYWARSQMVRGAHPSRGSSKVVASFLP